MKSLFLLMNGHPITKRQATRPAHYQLIFIHHQLLHAIVTRYRH